MDDTLKDEIGAVIETQISKLEREIAGLEAQSTPVNPRCPSKRLTREEAMQERELSARLLAEARQRLGRLYVARANIRSNKYGFCALCDEEIPAARLRLLPESTICVQCAAD